jgi:hypothetical protein
MGNGQDTTTLDKNSCNHKNTVLENTEEIQLITSEYLYFVGDKESFPEQCFYDCSYFKQLS